MAGQAALGQPVVILGAPAELMHQGPQRDGAIHAAPGDHDLRTRIETKSSGSVCAITRRFDMT